MAEGRTSLIAFSYRQIVQTGHAERALQSVTSQEAMAVQKGAGEAV